MTQISAAEKKWQLKKLGKLFPGYPASTEQSPVEAQISLTLKLFLLPQVARCCSGRYNKCMTQPCLLRRWGLAKETVTVTIGRCPAGQDRPRIPKESAGRVLGAQEESGKTFPLERLALTLKND